MKIIILFYIYAILLLFFPKLIFAQEDHLTSNQFINIVNPIRISVYSPSPKDSLASQYSEVKKRKLPATWLFNYDVLADKGIMEVAQEMDKSQELGLFLEITPVFSSEAGVIYNKTDSWHRANSVFLSGYTQEDRIKLIDTLFEKFKKIFGDYPKSVGAWWIDSYSLSYMQKKYNITANLTCADQFEMDGYQIWGQPWSVPFYPNKIHAGIPASSINSKLDVVTIQWAARDPLNGYGSSTASRFSTQDYTETEYFKKLVNLYAKSHNNMFGQLTVGLEGDFPPQSYGGFFASWLDVIKQENLNGNINVTTMSDFSNWYRNKFPQLSPVYITQSDDFLGKRIKSIWYNSPYYRMNIVYDYGTKETRVKDFRTYQDNFQEPYYISPNRDLNLSINIPSHIDSVSNQEEEWKVSSGELVKISADNEILILSYKNDVQIKLTKDNISFDNIKNIPDALINSAMLDFKRQGKHINLMPKINWNFPKEGLIFRSLTQEATYFLKQRKIILLEILITLTFFTVTFFTARTNKPLIFKVLIISSFTILILGGGLNWYIANSKLYFVSQAEIDALNRLKYMPGKRIIIFDRVCLQCSWHTQYMPAVFANKREYVKRLTGKEIIYNSSVFAAKTRPDGRQELNKLNADYIYAVNFEDYRELVPFSPGDLNIDKIYANANAQIWKIRKK